jgi:hypothetical protein
MGKSQGSKQVPDTELLPELGSSPCQCMSVGMHMLGLVQQHWKTQVGCVRQGHHARGMCCTTTPADCLTPTLCALMRACRMCRTEA